MLTVYEILYYATSGREVTPSMTAFWHPTAQRPLATRPASSSTNGVLSQAPRTVACPEKGQVLRTV